MWVSGLREVVTLRGPGSRAGHLADLLLAHSGEFRDVWDAHEVGIRRQSEHRHRHTWYQRKAGGPPWSARRDASSSAKKFGP